MIELNLSKKEADLLHSRGWIFKEKSLVLYDFTEKDYTLVKIDNNFDDNEEFKIRLGVKDDEETN